MKIKSATFEVSSPSLASCPRLLLPEFAFIGRSNVGKSSLINLIAEKKDLARVSDLPGKTRLINFFTMNANWRLVDLPGYGYAHVAKTERAAFNEATADYLQKREKLLHTYVLIDSRLPPQGIDKEFINWIVGIRIPFSIIYTKADKQSAAATHTSTDRFAKAVLAGIEPEPLTFVTSSKTKTGRTALLTHMAGLMAAAKAG